jgi:hypothetical protein
MRNARVRISTVTPDLSDAIELSEVLDLPRAVARSR